MKFISRFAGESGGDDGVFVSDLGRESVNNYTLNILVKIARTRIAMSK